MVGFVVVGISVFVASMIQAVTGLGHGMICMAVGTMFFPYLPMMLSTKAMTFVFGTPVILFQRKHIHWRLVFLPAIASFVGNELGVQILQYADERMLKLLLSVLLISISAFSLLVKKNISIKPSFVAGSTAGILTGFFAGVCGVGGPPLAIYFLNIPELQDDRIDYYATLTATFQLVYSYQVITTIIRTGIPEGTMTCLPLVTICSIVGLCLGQKILYRINANSLKTAVYGIMLVLGIMMVVTNY